MENELYTWDQVQQLMIGFARYFTFTTKADAGIKQDIEKFLALKVTIEPVSIKLTQEKIVNLIDKNRDCDGYTETDEAAIEILEAIEVHAKPPELTIQPAGDYNW